MIRAVRRIQFCSGHRVFKHEGKCRHPHGHNYVVFFHAEAEQGLDSVGRVIDFSILKEKLGGWIDENWDHGFIYHHDDNDMYRALTLGEEDNKIFALPDNPTAENMAKYLLNEVCPSALRSTGVHVTKVVLWETENCYAEVSL